MKKQLAEEEEENQDGLGLGLFGNQERNLGPWSAIYGITIMVAG